MAKSKGKRKITVDTKQKVQGSTNNNDVTPPRRPSVFERLGPGSTSLISTSNRKASETGQIREKCRYFARTGVCTFGNSCRYQHPNTASTTSIKTSKKEINEDLRSKVTIRKPEKEEKKEVAAPKRSRSRSSKREPETKIKSQVVVTNRKLQRSSDRTNDEWDGEGGGDRDREREWRVDRSQLDFEEELTLEKKRQQLQRELELEMQKERLMKSTHDSVIVQKRVASTTSSGNSSSSSSSSSTSSSSTSSSSSSSSSSDDRRSSSSSSSAAKKTSKKKRDKKVAVSESSSSSEDESKFKRSSNDTKSSKKEARNQQRTSKASHMRGDRSQGHGHVHKTSQTKAKVSLGGGTSKIQQASMVTVPSNAVKAKPRQPTVIEKVPEKHGRKRKQSATNNAVREQAQQQVKSHRKVVANVVNERPQASQQVRSQTVMRKKVAQQPPAVVVPHKDKKKQKPKPTPAAPPPMSEVRRAIPEDSSYGRPSSPRREVPPRGRHQSPPIITTSLLHPAYLAEHERRMAKNRPPSPEQPEPPRSGHRGGVLDQGDKGGYKGRQPQPPKASNPVPSASSHKRDKERERDYDSQQGFGSADDKRYGTHSHAPPIDARMGRNLGSNQSQRGSSLERSNSSWSQGRNDRGRAPPLDVRGTGNQSSRKDDQGSRRSKHDEVGHSFHSSSQSVSDMDRGRDTRHPPQVPFDGRGDRRDVPQNRSHGDSRQSLLGSRSSKSPDLRGMSSDRGLRGKERDRRDRPSTRGLPLEIGDRHRPPETDPRYMRTMTPPPGAHGRYHSPTEWPEDRHPRGQQNYSPDRRHGHGMSPSRRESHYDSRQAYDEHAEIYDYGRTVDRGDHGRELLHGRHSMEVVQRRDRYSGDLHSGVDVLDLYDRPHPVRQSRQDFGPDNQRSDYRGDPKDRWGGDSRDQRGNNRPEPDVPFREPDRRREENLQANMNRKRGREEPLDRTQNVKRRPGPPPATAPNERPIGSEPQKPRDNTADQNRRGRAPRTAEPPTIPKNTKGNTRAVQPTVNSKAAPQLPKPREAKNPVTKPVVGAKDVRRRVPNERKEGQQQTAQPASKTDEMQGKRKRSSSPDGINRNEKKQKPITAAAQDIKITFAKDKRTSVEPESKTISVETQPPPAVLLSETKTEVTETNPIESTSNDTKEEQQQQPPPPKRQSKDAEGECGSVDRAGSFSDWSDDSQDLLNRDDENEKVSTEQALVVAATETEEPVSKEHISKEPVSKESVSKPVLPIVSEVAQSDPSTSIPPRSPAAPVIQVEKIKEESRRSSSTERSDHGRRRSRLDGSEDSRSDGHHGRDRDRDRNRDSRSGRSSRPTSRHTSLERANHRVQHEPEPETPTVTSGTINTAEVPDVAAQATSNVVVVETVISEERIKLPDMEEGVVIDSVGPDPSDKVGDLDGYDYDPISDDELDAMMEEPDDRSLCKEAKTLDSNKSGIIDALEVDWASLMADKQTRPRLAPKEILKQFNPARVLSRIGVSVAYAGPVLLERIKESFKEVATSGETGSCTANDESTSKALGFELQHDIAAIHSSTLLQKREFETIMDNVGPYRQALCARQDLHIRKRLCQLGQKQLESPPVFTPLNVDCEMVRLGLQLFKRCLTTTAAQSL